MPNDFGIMREKMKDSPWGGDKSQGDTGGKPEFSRLPGRIGNAIKRRRPMRGFGGVQAQAGLIDRKRV